MSPMMFPFLTGMVPPLVKEKLGQARPQRPVIEEERRPIVEEVTRVGQPVGIGNLQQAFMQRGPLSGLSQFINEQLAQENQGEVQEFIGEVGDMANQRFGVDLGAVGQRPMFRPELIRAMGPQVQGYKDGGAAFPDVTGPGGGPPDGKVTQADVLKLRGVELKEYGGPIGMEQGGDPVERELFEKFGLTKAQFVALPEETKRKLLGFILTPRKDLEEGVSPTAGSFVGGRIDDAFSKTRDMFKKFGLDKNQISAEELDRIRNLQPQAPRDPTYDAMIKREQPSDRMPVSEFQKLSEDERRKILGLGLVPMPPLTFPQREMQEIEQLFPEGFDETMKEIRKKQSLEADASG